MSGISRWLVPKLWPAIKSSRGGEFLPTRRTLFPLDERERAVTEWEATIPFIVSLPGYLLTAAGCPKLPLISFRLFTG